MSKTTLDEKLDEILDKYAMWTPATIERNLDGSGKTTKVLVQRIGKNEAIAAIHAAFKESGYARVAKHPYRDEQHTINYPDGSREFVRVPTFTTSHYQDAYLDTIKKEMGWMTGQEFYDGFVKEYHMRADWISADPSMGDDAEHDVLLAAKLAAGVTHD